jgi:hypothetical protein
LRDFHLVLCSRERPDHLENLFDSLVATTKDLSRILVTVGFDRDDKTIPGHLIDYPFSTAFQYQDRDKNLNAYLNRMATPDWSRYTIILNDDVEFLTPDWDETCLWALHGYLGDKPDGIVYGIMEDNSTDKISNDYAPFPILSAAGIRALGYAMPAEFVNWGSDFALGRIYSAVGRTYRIPGVKLKHTLHSDGKQGDHLRPEMMEHFMANRRDFIDCDISKEVSKLERAIRK